MKRFYKTASVLSGDGGFQVTLDGRPVRSPAKAALMLPTSALADAVAGEWDAQGDKIEPASMPMMSLASTAIDRVAPERDAVAADAAGYAASDLLCYRADSPVDLALRQAEAWDPVLDWAHGRYGVVFSTTAGIMPITQPEETLERIRGELSTMDAFALTGLHAMTTILGSVVLALAVTGGARAPDEAFELSRIDETYQEELWGQDAEAADRRTALEAELRAAYGFWTLLRVA